jgi:hypothetical protein
VEEPPRPRTATPSDVAVAVPPRAPSAAAAQETLDRALEWIAASQREDGTWPEGEPAESWLAAAQRADGSWPADMQEDPLPAHPAPRVVGVTGLCVLALSGSPRHADAVERGRAWLYEQQDRETGAIAAQRTHDFLYGHGIATYALVVTAPGGRSDVDAAERGRLQAAINFILSARNPYAAWRYQVPPDGDNDTSVTGWMLAALDAARERGWNVDAAALEGGLAWLDEVTDPRSGRVGYDSFGSLSSRTPQNEHFPRERGEAMTAVGLTSRVELRGAEVSRNLLASHARLLKRNLPVWDPKTLGVDMYYWYHGTRGMRALGGADGVVWRAALLSAAVEGQAADGSWDPVGPWGTTGGRAYATALMALSVAACLE